MKTYKKHRDLTIEDAHLVRTMADLDMRVSDVADHLFMHRNTVIYRINKIEEQTGLDARKFHDLCKLVRRAKRVLTNKK